MAAQDRVSLALAASQMRAVLSADAVTMRDPSALKAAAHGKLSWPARRQFSCETATASAAAADEALVLSAGKARSMRVPRAASLTALSKSLRDSLAAESSARMLACAWASASRCSSANLRCSSAMRRDPLGIDFRRVRALAFAPDDQRQIQDMRRSGAVEAVRGNAAPMKLSAKMANTIGSSNRLHRTYVPVDVAAVRDVDEAWAAGRERNRVKKLQLRAAKKLQPK